MVDQIVTFELSLATGARDRMVQSDVKRFGIYGYTIYYKHYYGNKLFE